ncbi:hypothetical protein BAE44_0005410 [Dichanthelium oligosanthes]|uniref:DUF6598 domain-containing protein n=1 Tax=Dichanthelium oligosanthes TaxID=888268 RepID=A0A1E5W817_9POAL|nr:hypothetical protein BAE44_0005410 [Dichanthelium oligosanthes]
MQFTDKAAPNHGAFPVDTLQVFSVKLAATRGRLQLPFDVFGMVAMRDPVDYNRNIIFQRTRDDCQTLTIEPHIMLLLAGSIFGTDRKKTVTGIGHERIVLLDSRGEKLPITGDGNIKLSRRVVSVETSGKVIVSVKALEGDKQVLEKETRFNPLKASSSIGELEFSFCKMEVAVFWSLISQY